MVKKRARPSTTSRANGKKKMKPEDAKEAKSVPTCVARLRVLNTYLGSSTIEIPPHPQVAVFAPFYVHYVEEKEKKKASGGRSHKRKSASGPFTAEEWLYSVPHIVFGRHSLLRGTPYGLNHSFISRLQCRVVYVNTPSLHNRFQRELILVGADGERDDRRKKSLKKFDAPYFLIVNYSEVGNEVCINDDVVLRPREGKELQEGDILSFLENAFDRVGGVLSCDSTSSLPEVADTIPSFDSSAIDINVELHCGAINRNTALQEFYHTHIGNAFRDYWNGKGTPEKAVEHDPQEELIALKPPFMTDNVKLFLDWIASVLKEKANSDHSMENDTTPVRERSMKVMNNHLIIVGEEDHGRPSRASDVVSPLKAVSHRDVSLSVGLSPSKRQKKKKEEEGPDALHAALLEWFSLFDDNSSVHHILDDPSTVCEEPLSPLQSVLALDVRRAKQVMRAFYGVAPPAERTPSHKGVAPGSSTSVVDSPVSDPSPIKALLQELRKNSV
ncbi:hypothetical protein AGDE_13387 [Angomonas deanei]|uniref:Uncharacterized protein n=1 Tax=Angomonas deanei TaxID=59799 RepID=A0A7G2C4F5_9TRYP|nr:hypothetical protein AGDE_13387 [Angomonas deanei]CAD2214610.1 hypothetical protein, conserved [Angomonas deanei]|eukprot:EPY22423.1 hypothetical protein AGDE_13387 [Angomonas deanei]